MNLNRNIQRSIPKTWETNIEETTTIMQEKTKSFKSKRLEDKIQTILQRKTWKNANIITIVVDSYYEMCEKKMGS